jgi:large subunit ribosomal protein L12
MEEVYAALLLHEAKQPITLENLTKILQAAGIQPDEGKLKALVTSLEGKNIDELIKQAEILPTTPAPAKEEKKAEKEEKKAEEAAAGLSALFA